MRKNKKRSKRLSVIALNTLRFGVVIVMAAVMSIVRMLADSSCDQLLNTIGEKERELNKLETCRERESSQWAQMQTTHNLEAELSSRGMAMRYPKNFQVVHMRPNGKPVPGQISVARALRRNGLSTAQYSTERVDDLPSAKSGRRRLNRGGR